MANLFLLVMESVSCFLNVLNTTIAVIKTKGMVPAIATIATASKYN